MKPPFKNFTVHITVQGPNSFTVYVNDLAKCLQDFKEPPNEAESYRCALERALFIEQAITSWISECK